MNKNTQRKKIRVAISLGDINGIGPEVIIKTLSNKDILEFFTPVIFGSVKVLNHYSNNLSEKMSFHGIQSTNDIVSNKINVVNLWKDLPEINVGKSTKNGGKCSFESLKAATESVANGNCDVLVTAPINKENIQSESFKFPGHTEFLGKQWEGNPIMFMLSDNLCVALQTQHIPLQDVAQNIEKKGIVQKVKELNQCLKQDFKIQKPKIAVLGLNPHAGDKGLLGAEDNAIIAPAVQELFNQNILAFGPYSADSFFTPNNLKNFDAVLAMYHDQGLIPFKTISFGEGVNYSASLPFIRTSPDHGVAYDIAGTGKADENSFRTAIYKAIEIYKNRNEYKELTENVLKVSPPQRRDKQKRDS